MVYGRIYYGAFSAVSVSAVQDLFVLRPATQKPCIIRKVVITPDDSETNQQLKITIRRLPATVTVTGGTSLTPTTKNDADAACGATLTSNHTTVTTTGGTALHLNPESFPSQGGFEFLPDIPERPIVRNADAFVVKLEEAPASAIPMSGVIVFEEI